MSAKSIERAKEFEWDNKAIKIVEIYEKMLAQKARVLTKNKEASSRSKNTVLVQTDRT